MNLSLRSKNIVALVLTALLAILLGILTGNAQTVIDKHCCLIEEIRNGAYLYSPKPDCELTIHIVWSSPDATGRKRKDAIKPKSVILYANEKRFVILDADGDFVSVIDYRSYRIVATKKGGDL